MCRHTPRAWYPAIQGQNDCRVPTKSEGRSGRGVETTRNSMIHTPSADRNDAPKGKQMVSARRSPGKLQRTCISLNC
jgi:hypothetical protein